MYDEIQKSDVTCYRSTNIYKCTLLTIRGKFSTAEKRNFQFDMSVSNKLRS